MAHIPVLGRIALWDYISLLLTFLLFLVDRVTPFCFIFLPFGIFKSSDKGSSFDDIGTAQEFAEYWGYPFEEFVVNTPDDYLLGIHRIPSSIPTAPPSPALSAAQLVEKLNQIPSVETLEPLPQQLSSSTLNTHLGRPVVLLWHGFLMNSEVFLCKSRRQDNLAFWLADLGFDVWIGNTRGNKYSLKHRSRSPVNVDFWNFSLDEQAQFDLPSTVDFILQATGASTLSYIGFSQGTAQAFAALSVNAELSSKFNIFIGLAPATAPKGLENHTVNAAIRASPNLIYLLFGRRSALSACLFWQDLLPRKFFVKVIDGCMHFLFRWKTLNMSPETKLDCYPHLYSLGSVKGFVHWFQIIRASRLQFYDDFPTPIYTNLSATTRTHITPPYPTRQITVPLAIFYGGSDTLSDIDKFFDQLPHPVFVKEVQPYEHLDFLWADDLPQTVFPQLKNLLSAYSSVCFPTKS